MAVVFISEGREGGREEDEGRGGGRGRGVIKVMEEATGKDFLQQEPYALGTYTIYFDTT